MAAINLGRRGRLAVKIGGFVVLGLVSFVFALQLTFPYRRVKDKLVEVLSTSYEVKVGDVSRGLMPGTFTLEKVSLRPRQTRADEVLPWTTFKTIEVDVGVLALFRGVGSADFELEMGGGTVEGSFEASKTSIELTATAHAIPAGDIPQIRELLGLPLIGKLNASVTFSLPKNDWRQASGSLTLDCPKNCTLGDGVTKFKPKVKSQRSATMMGEGIEFGHVYIDKVASKVVLKGGKLQVTKFEFLSKDAELKVELEMKLGKKLKESEIATGCIRFRATEALQAREAKTAAAIATTGGVLGPDNLFHIKLEGRVADLKPRGRICSGEGAEDDTGTGGISKAGRPMLTPVAPDVAGAVRPPEVPDVNPMPMPPPQPADVPIPPDAAPAAPPVPGAGGIPQMPQMPAAPPGANEAGRAAPPSAETRDVPQEPVPPVAPKENE